jgi:hypothetical protein
MPFNRTDPMKERVKFILAWEKRWQESQGGRIDEVELCRVFGIRRDTATRGSGGAGRPITVAGAAASSRGS